ncbi:MAG: efflux RND transporter permease subunit, partial [Rhizobiales bacterium]|nr:efflux RND transporter permease subunit [Hyphomicrobiales bacterium]
PFLIAAGAGAAARFAIGVVPLLIADGAGAKSRFDIGIVIAAGMTIGTLFTLFITPAIYSFVARDRRVAVNAVEPAPIGEVVPLPAKPTSKLKPHPQPPMSEAAE